MRGNKILDGLRDAVAGNFAAVTIEGQRWARAPEWRLIETAPKDGTPMLFCHWTEPEQDVLPVVSGFWSRLSEGWYAELSGQMIKPTHWMPLMAPPSSRGQGA